MENVENLDWLLDKDWKPSKVTVYTNIFDDKKSKGDKDENKQ